MPDLFQFIDDIDADKQAMVAKTVRKCQNLRQSGKTFSTKLGCPSRGVFTNLVAVPARCAARSHQDRVLLEAWLDPTYQPV